MNKYKAQLQAAYAIEGITSAREKSRIRSYVYRLDTDWDKTKMPSLAVAFGVLSLTRQDKYPGWIPDYQRMAVDLSDRIDAFVAAK